MYIANDRNKTFEMYGSLRCRLDDANITTRFSTTAVIMHIIANGEVQYDRNVLVPSFKFPFTPDSFDCRSTASEKESISLTINHGDSDGDCDNNNDGEGVGICNEAVPLEIVDDCIQLVDAETPELFWRENALVIDSVMFGYKNLLISSPYSGVLYSRVFDKWAPVESPLAMLCVLTVAYRVASLERMDRPTSPLPFMLSLGGPAYVIKGR